MAVEHNFARGDILRKVLERTGLAARRPLDLSRGGLDQAAGAALLRRARAFSQHAAMLSSKLDDLIELDARFKSYPAPVLEAAWKRWKKPSRKTLGGMLKRHDPRGRIPQMIFRDLHKQPRELSVLLDEVINFQDPRPRNLQGEFEPQGSGGPDPNAMATVYKMPQPTPQGPTATQGAAAALVGGALGSVGGNIGKTSWAASRKAIKHLAARRKGVSKIIHP